MLEKFLVEILGENISGMVALASLAAFMVYIMSKFLH